MKEREEEQTEELAVLSEEIRVLDIRQSIDQLLRSLEFKCKDMKRLPEDTYLDIESSDGRQLEISSGSDGMPGYLRSCGGDEVLAIDISGQNDSSLTEEEKKMRPYIKAEIKTEPGLEAKVKREPVG